MTTLDREVLADWVECSLLVRGGVPLGLDALHTYAEEFLGVGVAQVSLAVSRMGKRAQILGAKYPFKVHGEVAVAASPGAIEAPYSALVLLASGGPVRQYLHPTPTIEMAVAFESITAAAVARLWGPEGRALRFGWPSDIGRPPEFPNAVEWLAGRMGIEVGAGYRQPRRKDGGVDVVGWRPFPDGRPGFPITLVQCTLQENLVAKAADVDVRLWGSWLSMDLDPVVALATPLTIPSGTTWDELRLKGMVLERLRLAGLAPLDLGLPSVAAWCRETVDALRDTMKGADSL